MKMINTPLLHAVFQNQIKIIGTEGNNVNDRIAKMDVNDRPSK